MRYMMVIKYDGSKFFGFQRQKSALSVQGSLEDNLSKILNDNIVVKGAGRTDRGVHAENQVVHFDTDKNAANLKKKLNSVLDNITVKKIKPVSNKFHARFSVESKTYIYKVDLSGNRDARYYLINRHCINIEYIKKAAKLFLGTHDFRNFVAGKRINYSSTITKIRVYKINNVLYLRFTGVGFFRYMVRNLVGALLEVGKAKIDKTIIKEMLDNNISKSLPTVSPNGLYLLKIRYKKNEI